MTYQTVLLICLLSTAINFVNCEVKAAQALLETGAINGTVIFTETPLGIHVAGVITGLPVGLYGLHVHEIGDVSTCDAAGAHFNPGASNHGGRDHSVRHVGDLGNVQFVNQVVGGPIATLNFFDTMIALNGTNNIIGRTLVLHEQEDDLGLGGHETSLTTGNAGARVACAIIRDVDEENSAGSISPSLLMFTLTTILMYVSL